MNVSTSMYVSLDACKYVLVYCISATVCVYENDVGMFTCVYAYVNINVLSRLCRCMYSYVHVHVHIHVYTHVFVFAQLDADVYVCVDVDIDDVVVCAFARASSRCSRSLLTSFSTLICMYMRRRAPLHHAAKPALLTTFSTFQFLFRLSSSRILRNLLCLNSAISACGAGSRWPAAAALLACRLHWQT